MPSATASNNPAWHAFLYGALDTKTGRVHGKTAARHTSRDFVAFLEEVVSLCPPGQQIYIILDNLSAHKTQLVRDFLAWHPPVQFHFTPNLFFLAQPSRDGVRQNRARGHARGIFTSVPDLARKLRRYINAYSPTPVLSGGNTRTLLAAYLLSNSLRQSTSLCPGQYGRIRPR
jgi:DDE superfamily endonuclease